MGDCFIPLFSLIISFTIPDTELYIYQEFQIHKQQTLSDLLKQALRTLITFQRDFLMNLEYLLQNSETTLCLYDYKTPEYSVSSRHEQCLQVAQVFFDISSQKVFVKLFSKISNRFSFLTFPAEKS